MSPLHLIISRSVVDDLENVWSFYASQVSPQRARVVISNIMDAIDRLAEMPGMGHERPDLPDGRRAWAVHKFLIVYRFDLEAIYVDRVVHGSRDIRRLFQQ